MSNHKALLLNASNMEAFPIFPYAFIQIPAVARQHGVEVVCKDLHGISQGEWRQTILDLIERHDPVLLMLTLRNTDTLSAGDYEQNGSQGDDAKPYFPIERTRELVGTLRKCTDLKIAVGGFGFSVMPDEIMRYLRPDFGVSGDPDGFFEHFEDIQAGKLASVPNLLYYQDGQLISNPQILYPPLAYPEYTPGVIDEMMAFYEAFPSPGFLGAPIEIMRGCCFSCVFCSEPLAKGSWVRYRELSAVMQDIKILADHGITELYMITSELNPEGNEFILELADMIRIFNQQQPDDHKVTWFGANYLLKFSPDDYKRLYQSGFTGGWFDVTALDDENARFMRTPYRNKHLVNHLKAYAHFQREQAIQAGKKETTEDDITVGWTMFLGNPATTIETLRNTLRIANQNGIPQLFDRCGVIAPIRVFDYEEPDQATLSVTYSVTADLARTNYRQILPSFAYPPALLHEFGSAQEIKRVFKHIGETYLSTRYQETRNWQRFLQQQTSAAEIASWTTKLAQIHAIYPSAHLSLTHQGKPSTALQDLFSQEAPSDEVEQDRDNRAKQVVDWLLSACLESYANLLATLGLPGTMDELEHLTAYNLAVAVFNRWGSEQALFEGLNVLNSAVGGKSMQAVVRFCVRAVLHKFNIIFTPNHKKLFISDNLPINFSYPKDR